MTALTTHKQTLFAVNGHTIVGLTRKHKYKFICEITATIINNRWYNYSLHNAQFFAPVSKKQIQVTGVVLNRCKCFSLLYLVTQVIPHSHYGFSVDTRTSCYKHLKDRQRWNFCICWRQRWKRCEMYCTCTGSFSVARMSSTLDLKTSGRSFPLAMPIWLVKNTTCRRTTTGIPTTNTMKAPI